MKIKIPVPYGVSVSVEIVRDVNTNTAEVIVHAPLYKVKTWKMPHCYSASQFSDAQIIKDRDFATVMCNHFPSDDSR